MRETSDGWEDMCMMKERASRHVGWGDDVRDWEGKKKDRKANVHRKNENRREGVRSEAHAVSSVLFIPL